MKKRILSMVLALLLALSALPISAAAPEETVVRSAQRLRVNGAEVSCDKYNIGGSNYFKLRDLAMLLNGTGSQFNVEFIGGVVTVTTGKAYAPVGGELEIGEDKSGDASVSAQTVKIDGRTVAGLSVYNIGGNNFFKLRDLGDALGFAVDYDAATNTASVTGRSAPPAGAAAPVSLSLSYSGGGHTDDNLGLWYIEEKAVTASPCADVDGDGKAEIIFNVRKIFCLDAATGAIKWMTYSGHDTSEPVVEGIDKSYGAPTRLVPTQIADVDGDGSPEIVTFTTEYAGSGKTFVGIYDGRGRLKAQIETPFAVRAAKLADLDNDGKMEITLGLGVGAASRTGGAPSVYVYNSDGTLRGGWPQDCGYGLYANSIEAVDLDSDGKKELVMLNDQAWIKAFHADGSEVVISSGPYAGRKWSDIVLYESYGFSQEYIEGVTAVGSTRESSWAIMGTHAGIVAADVDGDGTAELVCTAMIEDLAANSALMSAGEIDSHEGLAKYFTAFILNRDHSRYVNAAKGYDWTAWPKDVGEIITLDDSHLPNPDLAPVAADLDGDGELEIVYGSYDGKVHCFRLDGAEHDGWPFTIGTAADPWAASKPAVADINGDGLPEVVFTTYARDNQMEKRGSLYVLSHDGRLLAKEELPQGWGMGGGDSNYGYANAGQAESVPADVDGDGKPEIIVTTLNCGVCVYKVS